MDKKIKIIKEIPIVYCGSSLQNSYGESTKKHGYLLWDVETLTYEDRDITTSYGFYQFKINNISDLEEGKDILLNA